MVPPKHSKVLNNLCIGPNAAPLNAFVCARARSGFALYIEKKKDLTPANPVSMKPTRESSRNKVICPAIP